MSTVGPLALLVDLQAPGESRSPALAALLSAVAAALVPRRITPPHTAVSQHTPHPSRLPDGVRLAPPRDQKPLRLRPHAARVASDPAAAKPRWAPNADWDAAGLALFTQAVMQGSFVLAKATADIAVARAQVAHLRRYVEMLLKPEDVA